MTMIPLGFSLKGTLQGHSSTNSVLGILRFRDVLPRTLHPTSRQGPQRPLVGSSGTRCVIRRGDRGSADRVVGSEPLVQDENQREGLHTQVSRV